MPQGIQHRVILVAVAPGLRVPIEAALKARAARVAAECPTVPLAIQAAQKQPEDTHLFLVGDADPARVAALGKALPGQPVLALLPAGSGLPATFALQRAGAAQVVPQPL